MALTGEQLSNGLKKLRGTLDRLVQDGAIRKPVADEFSGWFNQFLSDPKLPKLPSGEIDTGEFGNLSEAEQDEFTARFEALEGAINRCVPTNPRSFMYGDFASNGRIWLLIVVGFAGLILALASIVYCWRDATSGCRERPSSMEVTCSAAETSAAPQPTAAPKDSAQPDNQPVPQAQITQPPPPATRGRAAGTQGSGSPANQPGLSLPATAARICPDIVVLAPSERAQLRLLLNDQPAPQNTVKWSIPSTGSMSANGEYVAPPKIADTQTLQITAKAQSGEEAVAAITLIPPRSPCERNVVIMILLMGALGGLLHLNTSFVMFVGNRQLFRSWQLYYLLMPLQGAALALLVYLLLRAGILTAATGTGGVSPELNFIGLYALAGLTGLFSRQALEKLAEVFGQLFKKVEAEDQLKSTTSQ